MSMQFDNNVITPNSIIANLYARKQACSSNLLDSISSDFENCLKDKFSSQDNNSVSISKNQEANKSITETTKTKAEQLLKSSLREIQTATTYALSAAKLSQYFI